MKNGSKTRSAASGGTPGPVSAATMMIASALDRSTSLRTTSPLAREGLQGVAHEVVQPAARLHPEVVAAMREVAVDISGATQRLLTPELAASAQLLVTMGCGDACPFVPSLRREDWSLDDPKGQPPEGVRAIRDEIQQPVQRLIEAEGWVDREPQRR